MGVRRSNVGPLKTSPFGQSLCQTQISILDILNVCLRLKSSPSLTVTKIEHFLKGPRFPYMICCFRRSLSIIEYTANFS